MDGAPELIRFEEEWSGAYQTLDSQMKDPPP